jgi:hypothetical protein
MKKEIKIIILGTVIFIVIMALLKPKIDYYLREGDVITIGTNMERVEHALNSWSVESSGKFPRSLEEKTEETNEPFSAFLLKEDWYEPPVFPLGRDRFKPLKERSVNVRDKWCKPIRRKFFYKVIKFESLMDTIPGRASPCGICICTDGIRFKIIGGDKNGYLVPEDITYERGASKPKVIYSNNYWNDE